MKTQQVTFLIPPYGTATLTLPALLTPDAFLGLDSAVCRELGERGHEPGEPVADDPGSIECDSWSAGSTDSRRN